MQLGLIKTVNMQSIIQTMVIWFYEVQDAGKLYLNSVTVSLDTALAGAHISLNCKHISFPRS